jgi:D-sedoheptulose 7-phosphate isomerase
MPTVSDQFNELADVVSRSREIIAPLEKAIPSFLKTIKDGGRILSCGNGGSAADALHLAEELVGRYRSNRQPYSAICLNADPTVLTCISNDWNYEEVFARQVEAHGREGDFLVCFTTSGNSINVLKALDVAKKRGVKTLTLMGKDGGKCRGLADFEVIVPSQNTGRIQEIHGWILHVLLEAVEGMS